MIERVVDLTGVGSPEDFYEVFFPATAGAVPDYGGRNLDALIDDLGDIEQPLTIVLAGCEVAAPALDGWLDQLLGSFAFAIGRADGRLTVVLRSAASD
jgi:RNAse (barnase) inhibitor barstar